MRSIVVCGPPCKGLQFPTTFQLGEVTVTAGLVETADPEFDTASASNAEYVLAKVKAFSCNYRDRALIYYAAKFGQRDMCFPVGSEFLAEIIAVGRSVRDLKIGERVIGDGSYPDSGVPGLLPGLPTNHGSNEYQVIHQRKLMRIPDTIPDAIAAAFPVGAQTTYAMIRRLGLKPEEHILVTSAKSNTSLFAINALRNHPVNVYVTSTSSDYEEELLDRGVKQLFVVDPNLPSLDQHTPLRRVAEELNGFDAVIDPFADLHLRRVASVMAYGGRYIFCGFLDQSIGQPGTTLKLDRPWGNELFATVMIRNLTVMGNCIGTREDLASAVSDCASGRLEVLLDSTLSESQVAAFFDRTFFAKKRLGKVVCQYK